MVGTNPFYKWKSEWFWAPELSYGKLVTANAQWAANEVGDTFYHLPIIVEEYQVFRNNREDELIWTGGSSYLGHIIKKGQKMHDIPLSGYQTDFSLFMMFLIDFCANAGGADPYTHQGDNADTLPAKVPTICLMRKMVNGDTNETKYFLYPGTVVKSYDGNCDNPDGKLRGSFVFSPARVVDGVAPTTEPTRTITEVLSIFNTNSSIVWANGATAYEGEWDSLKIHYGTDKKQYKGGGSVYPVSAFLPNKREFYIEPGWTTYETTTYDDSEDDPHTDLDKNLTITLARSATSKMVFTFTDVYQKIDSNEFEKYLIEFHKMRVNPGDSGSTWDVTETNSYAATRYALNT